MLFSLPAINVSFLLSLYCFLADAQWISSLSYAGNGCGFPGDVRTELLGRTQEPQGFTTYKDHQSIELDSASSKIQFYYGGTHAIKSFQRGPLGFRWFLPRTRFPAEATGPYLIGGLRKAGRQGYDQNRAAHRNGPLIGAITNRRLCT